MYGPSFEERRYMAAVVIQQACRQIGREQFTVWLGYTGNLLSNLIETMNLYEIAKVRRQDWRCSALSA